MNLSTPGSRPDSVVDPAAALAQLAARVRAQRLNRNWSQQEMATRCGISRASYQNFERTGAINVRQLLKVLAVLGAQDRFAELVPEPVVTPLEVVMPPVRLRAHSPRRRRPQVPFQQGGV